jgi:hypothetical protein
MWLGRNFDMNNNYFLGLIEEIINECVLPYLIFAGVTIALYRFIKWLKESDKKS